jgi:hypothetical protein
VPQRPRLRSSLRAASACLAAACALLLAACDTATAPPPPTQVVLLSHAGPVTLLPDAAGGSHHVRCEITYELVGADAQVRWLDALFQFHFGAARTSVDESIQVDGHALERSWEPLRVDGRALLGSRWLFVSPVPFSITAEMAYTLSGSPSVRVARSRTSCGPEPGAADGVPRVTATVTPLSAPTRGSPLRVSYAATSTLGLWETAIHVTGAWQEVIRVPEGFRTDVAGEVVLTVPDHALAGMPVNIAVSTVDAALRSSFVTFATAPVH